MLRRFFTSSITKEEWKRILQVCGLIALVVTLFTIGTDLIGLVDVVPLITAFMVIAMILVILIAELWRLKRPVLELVGLMAIAVSLALSCALAYGIIQLYS